MPDTKPRGEAAMTERLPSSVVRASLKRDIEKAVIDGSHGNPVMGWRFSYPAMLADLVMEIPFIAAALDRACETQQGE